MGAPGWPEFAFCTASIASVRIVFTQSASSEVSVMSVPSISVMSVAYGTAPRPGAGFGGEPAQTVVPLGLLFWWLRLRALPAGATAVADER